MKLKLIRHLWGVEQPWEQAFATFEEEGYVGVEAPLVAAKDQERFAALRRQHGFEYVAMAFTSGEMVADHVRSFEQQYRRAAELGASQLTAHGGLDAWPIDAARAFYREVLAIERAGGPRLPVAHETHRGRVLYNPWVTRALLEEFESLHLCCDFSHWVCVAERTTWDDAAGSILRLCAQRCLHVHARVGYAEGPQVPDPSAPEYARDLAAHVGWWREIWDAQRARGLPYSTVTPEFGPPGYLHTLPHTDVPVADLAKVCRWMAERVARLFDTHATASGTPAH